MSTNEVINWSSGYDAGFEEGVKSAFLSLADRDMSDKEEEAWCEGFIEAWNFQAYLHPEPVDCADWMTMDD